MSVRFKVFESATKSWEKLFEEAAAFASELKPERLIGISHCSYNESGIVTVWYWDGD
jgi:hypothetical protein